MKRSIALLVILVLAGCSTPSPPPSLDTHAATPADAIRASRLTASMRSADGSTVHIYLHASDERTSTQTDPSCLAERGDTIRTGTYTFYIAADDASDPLPQSVTPFGESRLSFNDQRPSYLQVLPRTSGGRSDLLVVTQYGSCSGNAVAILALSPDGKELLQYRFKPEGGEPLKTIGTKVVQQLPDGRLQTSIYNNAIGKTTTTTWEVRDEAALLVAVETEVH